jgi:MFS family permease
VAPLTAPALLVRNRQILRVELAWAASSLGHWIFFVVLAVYAYRVGGAAAVGLATFVRMLPAAIGAPLTALLGDRHSRRTVLAASYLVKGASLGLIALAVAGHAGLGVVLALAALETVASTAEKVAMSALLPALSRNPIELAAANIAANAIESGAFMLGALVGGVMAAALSASLCFGFTAALFLAAALLGALIERDSVPEHRSMAATAFRQQALSGLRAVRDEPELRLLFGVISATTFVEGMVDVLVVAAAIELLGLGDAGVGYLNSAWGVGGMLGAAVAVTMLGRGRLAAGLGLGCMCVGVPLLGVAAMPGAAGALVLLGVLGVGYALIEVASQTLLQRLVSDEVLARVFGAFQSSYYATEGLGALACPLLINWLGVRGAALVVGAALPLVAIVRWSRLARFEMGAPVPAREFGLLRSVSLFAPVPLATVENLARRVRHVHVDPGATVIRQGEPGSTFYVIADGEVEVTVDGAWRRNEAAGEFFGEIALLRESPRTATVTAVAPTTLLELDGDTFVSALTGYPRSLHTADRVIGERLEAPAPSGG